LKRIIAKKELIVLGEERRGQKDGGETMRIDGKDKGDGSFFAGQALGP
jgi:hypothetical protein